MVHEHPVASAAQVKGDALVGLIARGAAVLVPALDALAVLDQRREPLAEAVHALSDAEGQLLRHVTPLAFHVEPGRSTRCPSTSALARRPSPSWPTYSSRYGDSRLTRTARPPVSSRRIVASTASCETAATAGPSAARANEGLRSRPPSKWETADADYPLHRRGEPDRQEPAVDRCPRGRDLAVGTVQRDFALPRGRPPVHRPRRRNARRHALS